MAASQVFITAPNPASGPIPEDVAGALSSVAMCSSHHAHQQQQHSAPAAAFWQYQAGAHKGLGVRPMLAVLAQAPAADTLVLQGPKQCQLRGPDTDACLVTWLQQQ